MAPESASEREADFDSYQDTRRILDNVAFSWIGPVFFVQLGTEIVLDWDVVLAVIPHTIALTTGLFVAQILSAGLAARYTSSMEWPDSLLVGLGMLGRAELAFVVMDIAYVQNDILSTEAFYTLMFTAFWLNVSVPVTINLWKRRYGARLSTAASGQSQRQNGTEDTSEPASTAPDTAYVQNVMSSPCFEISA